MPTQVQFRRGTTAQNNNFVGAAGEISSNGGTVTSGGDTTFGTLTAGGSVGTSGQVLAATGTGVQWTTPTAGADEILVLMGAY